MFGFLPKQVVDAAPVLRRIVDVTIPNKSAAQDIRTERRFNRTLAVVVTPCDGFFPLLSESIMGVTNDICDRGIGVITMEALDPGEYVVSIWPDEEQFEEPVHLRCVLVSCRRFAHGLWASGHAIQEVMNSVHRKQIRDLTDVARRALQKQAMVAT